MQNRDLLTIISQPKLFVFVEGYLGYNEIVAISKLETSSEKLIYGSHLIVNPRQYLE
jgi:hypothetical protein